MALSDVPNHHVWLCEEVTDKPDGTRGVTRRMRSVRGGASAERLEIGQVLDELAEAGVDTSLGHSKASSSCCYSSLRFFPHYCLVIRSFDFALFDPLYQKIKCKGLG